MPPFRDPRVLLALPLAALLACGGAPAPAPTPVAAPSRTTPATTPAPSRSSAALPLPPVPEVDGPLAIKVVYPSPNQQITSRDSNFIFGSVGSGKASLTVNGVPARVYPNGSFMLYLVNPPVTASRYDLVAVRGADTTRGAQPIRLIAAAPPRKPTTTPAPEAPKHTDSLSLLNARLDSLRTRLARDEPIGVVSLGNPSAMGDSDLTIVGRPLPGGTYKWFFTPGTLVPLMERTESFARIRLDHDLDVWVENGDARDVAPPIPARQLSNMRVRSSAQGADVIIPIGRPAPWFVEETPHSIVLTIYGVRGNTDIINYASADTMVTTVEWLQETADRARVTVNLRSAPYGYLVLFERNSLVLKLRGRPAINATRPLAGLTIAVDPGHPPVGSTGPTGLYEPQATLPVGIRLKRILEERGATVVMTRTTDSAIALGDRPIIARRANVNAFVSIHYNALPDGVNPFTNPGTGTYFFRTQSEPLAREVQRSMVSQLGLPDLGINYDNLAVVRGTWYPAVLCEGAFIMMPDQEAAMRNPEFQERYARGVADGLENYFRTLPSR
ncbi:MAG: N-acetylmuramoyl-L-alanine amidase [bacterium]